MDESVMSMIEGYVLVKFRTMYQQSLAVIVKTVSELHFFLGLNSKCFSANVRQD